MDLASEESQVGMGHLLPEVREVVRRPPDERILFARQDRWIEYPAAATIIGLLSDLLAAPLEGRPRGFLVVARPDNGKSSLLGRFEALHPPSSSGTGQAIVPVVVMSMPDEPVEAKIWMALLDVLRVPYRVTDAPKVHKAQAKEMLEAIGCRMLVVDEIHDLLQGSARQSSHALVLLKALSNELKLRLVVAGTDKAWTALSTDAQISTRFEYALLPQWRPTQALRKLLKGMEAVMPLAKPSNLDGREMVMALSARAGVTIGGYVKLVQAAAVEAIRQGKERMDPDLVAKVNVRTIEMHDKGDREDY